MVWHLPQSRAHFTLKQANGSTFRESAVSLNRRRNKDAIAKKKHVCDKADIKLINNFDIERYVVVDVETRNQVLKTLLQIIRAYSIPNILDLHEFIEENGASYGIDMNLFLTTIESKSSILRLYFDGAYQRSKRGEVKQKFWVRGMMMNKVLSEFPEELV